MGDIRTRFALEGEREYKREVTAINNNLRVLNSELKLNTTQYKDNAKSVASLASQGDVLNRQVEAQRDKIQKLQAALQNAERSFGATDKRTLNWQISLNKAKTELLNMESALRRNGAELQDATEDMKEFGLSEDEVADKSSKLGKRIIELSDQIGIKLPANAQKAVEGIDGMSVASAALLAISAKMIKNLVDWTKETAAYSAELTKTAEETGLTTQQLQELDYVSKQLYIDQDLLIDSMSNITQSMAAAKNGSQEAISAYARLGVQYKNTDGSLRDSTEVYWDVVEALNAIEDETTRDAIATQLFGKSSKELTSILNKNKSEFQSLTDEARELGLVMDQQAIDKFNRLQTVITKFESQSKALEQTLALALLPILTFLLELLTAIPTEAMQILMIVIMIITVVTTMAVTIGKVASSMKSISDATKLMNKDLWKTVGIIITVVIVLTALAAIIAVIIGKSQELSSAMQSVGDVTNSVNAQVSGAQGQYNNIPAYARGTSYHKGGPAIVGEEGLEIVLLPRGAAVIPHKKSMEMLRGGNIPAYANGVGGFSGGDTYNLAVSSRDLQNVAQMTKVFERARQKKRAE